LFVPAYVGLSNQALLKQQPDDLQIEQQGEILKLSFRPTAAQKIDKAIRVGRQTLSSA